MLTASVTAPSERPRPHHRRGGTDSTLPSEGRTWRDSPTALLLLLAATVFGVEFGIMVAFQLGGDQSTWTEVILDPFLTVLFLSPALFLFVVQPFRRKAERQRKAEAGLRAANRELSREIAERQQAEARLTLERNRSAAILEYIQDGICILDEKNEIQYANPYLVESFGPFQGRACHEYFRGAPEVCAGCPREGLQPGAAAKCDFLPTSSGRTLELFVAPIPLGDGRNGTLAVAHDVTERIKREQAVARSRDQFRRLSARVEAVREAERRRISREIHDELGQSLTALKFDLALLPRRLAQGIAPAEEKLATMSALVDDTIAAVQRICLELRPGLLDDLGPAAAFEWQAKEFEERTGIACELTLEPKEISCDGAVATALFRIFQEALTNVARHSGAELVEVRLCEAGQRVTLTVEDNGHGIDPEQVAASTSLGLLGIRERAAQLGGEATIARSPGGGTVVTITVPKGGSHAGPDPAGG